MNHKILLTVAVLTLSLGRFVLGQGDMERYVFQENFDRGIGEWRVTDGAELADDRAFSGKSSLRLRHVAGGPPVEARHSIPFIAGHRLWFSAKILSPDSWPGYQELEDYGGYMVIEWFDKDGNRLGKTGDFQLIRPSLREPGKWGNLGGRLHKPGREVPLNGDSVTPVLSKDVDRVDVVLKVSPGTTADFYFDAIEIRPIPAPVLVAEVVRPRYKRALPPQGEGEIEIQFQTAPQFEGRDAGNREVRVTLWGPGDELITERIFGAGDMDWHRVVFPIPSEAPQGEYAVEIALVDREIEGPVRLDPDVKWGLEQGPAIEGRRFVFFRREVPPRAGTMVVDEYDRLVRDGEPVFSRVLYLNTSVDQAQLEKALAELEHIAEAGAFDAVMNYGIVVGDMDGIQRYLDKAAEVGLGVVFCLKDIGLGQSGPTSVPERYRAGLDHLSEDPDALAAKLVETFRDHPALYGWYISDEDSLYKLKRLNERYELVSRLDPYNPVFAAYITTDFGYYIDTGDVVGMHVYPIGRRQGHPYGFRSVYERTKAAGADLKGRRLLSYGVQMFDYHAFERDLPGAFPSESQLRNMLYQSYIAGTKMVFGYSYTFMIRGYRAMGKDEIRGGRHDELFRTIVAPVFREARDISPFLLSSEESPAVNWVEAEPEGVVARWWKEGDSFLFLAANTGRRPVDATVDLSGFPEGELLLNGASHPFSSNLRIAFEPYQTASVIIRPIQNVKLNP